MLLKYNPTNERQFNNGKGKSVRGAYQFITITASKGAANDRDILAYWTVTRYFEWNQLEVWKKRIIIAIAIFFAFFSSAHSPYSHTLESVCKHFHLLILLFYLVRVFFSSSLCFVCYARLVTRKIDVYTRSSQTSSVVSLHKPIHVVDAHIKLILLRSVWVHLTPKISYSLSLR